MKLLIEKNNHRTKLKRKKRQKIYIERETGCKNIFLWPELSVSLLLNELQPICLLRVTSNISTKVSGSVVGMQTSVSGWEVLDGTDYAGFSLLCLLCTCCSTTFWNFKAPPCPCLWRGFHMCRNFYSFTAPISIPFSFFFFLFLSP